jgi:hypothetical protein
MYPCGYHSGRTTAVVDWAVPWRVSATAGSAAALLWMKS